MSNTRFPSPPNPGFIIIVDVDGDVVEHFSPNSVIDEVMRRMEILDKENPGDSPHSAWSYDSGGFTRVFDGIHKDPR
jgi:hypothetical protein